MHTGYTKHFLYTILILQDGYDAEANNISIYRWWIQDLDRLSGLSKLSHLTEYTYIMILFVWIWEGGYV